MKNKKLFYIQVKRIIGDNIKIIDNLIIYNLDTDLICNENHIDKYDQLYNTINIKHYLDSDAIYAICDRNPSIYLFDPSIVINLITSLEYEKYDADYANKKRLVEYINEEKNRMDKITSINKDVLINNGFTCENENIDNGNDVINCNIYKKLIVSDTGELNIIIHEYINDDITNYLSINITNTDNDNLSFIKLYTIWQFNKLMEIFNSNFRL